MKVNAFHKWLDSCNKVPLLLINGPEDFFKLETIKKLRIQYPNSEYFSYISDEINLGKATEIVTDADTVPFLSDKKIFYLRDIDKFNEKVLSIFNDYFDSIPPHSIFVLAASALDGRTKFFKKINKTGAVLKASSLYENECSEWVSFLLKRLDKTIDRDAENLFISLIGNSLVAIENELKKLCVFTKDKNNITYEDILTATHSIKISSIFELTDSIGNRDYVQALALLKKMTDQGTNEIVILSMVARHFRIILNIQDLLRRKWDRSKIASELKINPYFINNYISQSSRIPVNKAHDFFLKICEADLTLKSLNWNSKQITESLVLSL